MATRLSSCGSVSVFAGLLPTSAFVHRDLIEQFFASTFAVRLPSAPVTLPAPSVLLTAGKRCWSIRRE